MFPDQCLKESTKAAAPAFTFAGKQELKVKNIAPSPNTYNTAGLTARGRQFKVNYLTYCTMPCIISIMQLKLGWIKQTVFRCNFRWSGSNNGNKTSGS